MKEQQSGIEERILAVIQEGLPGSRTPYDDMARRVGIKPRKLLEILKQWKQQGKLRRIGAIVNHFKLGLSAGAMVVWKVEPQHVEEVGQMLAAFEQVSHAYERDTTDNWPYNLYTMVHAGSCEELLSTVERMSKACGVSQYKVLATEKELKKVGPRYITQ